MGDTGSYSSRKGVDERTRQTGQTLDFRGLWPPKANNV
jgi:hypothetical protein